MSDPAQSARFSFDQVRSELHGILHEQCDIGVFKIVSGWVLDRGNRFDRSKRSRLKPEFLLFLVYLLLLAAAFILFNR